MKESDATKESGVMKNPGKTGIERAAYWIAGGMVISSIILVVGFAPGVLITLLVVALLALPIILIAGPNHWFGHPRDPKPPQRSRRL